MESDSGPSYRLLSPSLKGFSPYVEIKPFNPYSIQGIEWKSNFRRKCPFLDYTSEELNERLEEFTNWIEIGLNKRDMYVLEF